MNYQKLLEKNHLIHQIAKKLRVTYIYVFGCVARGETDDKSDVDFLVDLEASRSLFDLGGLQYVLQESSEVSVDVVTEDGLRGKKRQRILGEAIEI